MARQTVWLAWWCAADSNPHACKTKSLNELTAKIYFLILLWRGRTSHSCPNKCAHLNSGHVSYSVSLHYQNIAQMQVCTETNPRILFEGFKFFAFTFLAIILVGARHQKVTLELWAQWSLWRNQQKRWRSPKQPIRPPEMKRHGHQVRWRPRIIPTKSRPTVRATGRWIAQRSSRGQYQHLYREKKETKIRFAKGQVPTRAIRQKHQICLSWRIYTKLISKKTKTLIFFVAKRITSKFAALASSPLEFSKKKLLYISLWLSISSHTWRL